MNVRFEWDEDKNLSNQRKHGVSFEQAAQVFLDPLHLTVLERVEKGEERWQTFGLSGGILLVMVAHTVVEDDTDGHSIDVIRIISARLATGEERRRYENG